MKFDSIGFDLDGTLWNALDTSKKAWEDTAKEFGVEMPSFEALMSVMGLNKIQLMTKLYPQFTDEQKNSFFDRSTERCITLLSQYGGELYEGVEETLDFLSKKFSLYIVSNCQEGYLDAFFTYHKLKKYFVDFQYSGSACLPKGENIKLVLERNNFKSSLYVGDTQGDKDAAKLANVPFVFASYGFGKVDSYDYIADKFSDIKEVTK